MSILKQIGIAIIISFVMISITHNIGSSGFGTSVTQISGTDKLSDLDTLINTVTSELNAGKMEISTTTLPLITTLTGLTAATSLAEVGTITTGTWNSDVLTVTYGGTGSSTLSANQVLLGNGTTQLGVVSGLGTSGQFLTSQGAATDPQWTTSAVSLSDDYAWTGTHTFNNSSNIFIASTTFAGLIASSTPSMPLQLNGVDYAFPSTDGASTTALMTDGSGGLSWNTIQTIVNTDVPKPVGSAGDIVTQSLSNQVGAAFSLRNRIVITKVSVNVTAVGTAGTANFAIYSEDGQTRHFSTTTSSISGTGLHEMILGTDDALTLDAGYYYFAHSKNAGGTDLTLSAYATITANIAEGGTGDSHLQGRFGNGAASLPATFDPTSDLTADGTTMVQFRLN